MAMVETAATTAGEAGTPAAWEAVIGLETHVQLGTASKIFTCASTTFGDDPNTHIDPVVCGLPGTLPVLNQKVLEYAVKAAMALNLKIAEHSKFDRKQYFYPDLPKNYQISQYDEPIAEDGWIEVEVAEKGKDTYLKTIGIERLHMEEDAGKLVHAGSDRLAGSTHSLVDYNRAGVALAEIVSKPDLRTGREAAEYASEIRRIMRYLGVSDGNMQEGSLRCDVNISVRRGPDAPFGTKVEIKNMNSFSAIQKAIDFEIARQIKAYEAGEPVVQETRLWDEGKQLTKSMRSKEGASDYRYFPDPDLGPIEVSAALREGWRAELPELPAAKRHRYADQLGLSQYDARVLTDERPMADYFEAVDQRRHRRPRECQPSVVCRAALPARAAGRDGADDRGGHDQRQDRQGDPARAAGAGRLPQGDRGATRPGHDQRPRGHHGNRGGAAGRPPRGGGSLPRRQDQAPGLLCGPADETNRWQGRSQAGQPDPQRQAEGLSARATCSSSCSRVPRLSST
jgi:aspartyl-tRNA(Asn)/glutamyl-tRNA(Gln) amidotransferase subunit B